MKEVDDMRTLRDAIYGLAVADALGVPVEFKNRDSYEVTEMVGFGTHNQKPGTWSDDTSMVLATCDSIREKGQIDTCDMREKFRAWIYDAEYIVDGVVFDCGITVSNALESGRGMDGEYDNGNGSLMRIVPLAFANATDEEIREASAITHAHELSKSICCKYVEIARKLIDGASVKDVVPEEIAGRKRDDVKSSGFVLDTFEAALWVLANTDNYKDAALLAVNLGSDTDTVGAVAGALAGIVYGIEGIPKEWMEALRGKEIIERCLF